MLVFSSANMAEYPVAGVPAAARAAREVALAAAGGFAVEHLSITVPGGWRPSERCAAELARLAPGLQWQVADADALEPAQALILRGESLTPAGAIPSMPANAPVPSPDTRAKADLDRAGREILLATGKAGDGIVSRHINRPISRAISGVLLNVPGVTPFHATLGTAAFGIAMIAALLFGGEAGLIAGAILFQCASIFDGVDGEIARATFRTSPAGAMLDSLVDAATNLAFFGGVAFNLWLQGQVWGAAAGACGLVMLAAGLFLIGRRARASQSAFTFDGIKEHVKARKSRLWQWLTWITMRDFIAAAMAVLIVIGLAAPAMTIFAAATLGWLAFTIVTLIRTRPSRLSLQN